MQGGFIVGARVARSRIYATCVLAALAFGVCMAGCSSGSPAMNSGGASSTSSSGASAASSSSGAPFTPASHPPFPQLTGNGGAILVAPRLVVIVGAGEPDAGQLFAFGDALLQSAWLRDAGQDYGVSETAGATSLHLTGAEVPATMDGTALLAYVNATIATNLAAAPDGHTIYLFFYPPGTGRGDGCVDLGAHGPLATAPSSGGPTDALAWVQRCPTPAGLSELDALTLGASHEVIESATDPYPPRGWALPYKTWALSMNDRPPWAISSWSYSQGAAVEVGDLCEGTNIQEGGFAYQRAWSTTAAAKGGDPCVPPGAGPYYSASPPEDWIVVPAGTTAMVPVTGWSTGPRPDWSVTVTHADSVQGGFRPTFADGTRTALVNNGTTAMLSVTTPDAPGAFAVFALTSSESAPDPVSGSIPQPASGDRDHVWIFGVRTTCSGCQPEATCGDALCDTSMNETCATCPDDCGPCGAVCGASNFAVPCGASSCPTHSTCQPDGSCACDAGYASQSCGGAACTGTACTYPDWWCVPAACGASGFTTQCLGFTCPAEALCAAAQACLCAPGSQVSTCDGQPCPMGGCSYPNYACVVCGAQPGAVACPGYACPSFSACASNQRCTCLPGYRAVSCGGEACNGTNCTGGQWWCYPE